MKHGICVYFIVIASIWTACSHDSVTTPTTPTPAQPTVTPSAPFSLVGVVQEPGQGGVVDVRVTDTASATSTQTDSQGRFYLTLLSGNAVHLRFEKEGFEPIELDETPSASIADVRIQKIIRLVAGEMVTPDRLAPNDLTYLVGAGQICKSCRLIRIVVPTTGTLHLRLTWSPPGGILTLGLWVGDRHIVPAAPSNEVDADVAAAAGEMIVYVDRVSPTGTTDHVPFALATSLTE
jgi:hypothetical protein